MPGVEEILALHKRAGHRKEGSVHRGRPTLDLGGRRPAATIPSKFETVLFTNNRERDGFGSTAHRFGQLENELPGPGTYVGPTPPPDTASLASLSKKGLGNGFASRTKRFTYENQGPIKPYTGPGPGAYDPTLPDQPASPTGAAPSAAFRGRTAASTFSRDRSPGPGEYDPTPLRKTAPVPARSSFVSGTKRFEEHDALRTGPAPGEYFAGEYVPYDGNRPRPVGSSVFRSGLDRLGRREEPLPPPPGPQGLPVPRSPEREREASSSLPAFVERTPGPGAYETDLAALRRGADTRASAVFQRPMNEAHEQRGVAGLAGPSHGPGPGAYELTAAEEERRAQRVTVSNAAFLSQAERGRDLVDRDVPGPAFYRPGKQNKKTFHLNQLKRWM
eukprot:tig00000404_g386.t1